MIDLSICSVSYQNRTHLGLNWHLAKRLNRDFGRCRWIIAENTPEGDPERLAFDDPRFRVLAGASAKLVPNYQHTEALHGCLEHADTRFVLVLDPDFYIVRPHWISEILAMMQDANLSFFGVPWHPRNSDKYRYFPCVHCLFIDQQKLPIDCVDLRPDREDQPVAKLRPEYRDSETAPASERSVTRRVADALWRASGIDARRKDYCDTGTRFYFRYAGDARHKFGLALPVLRLPAEAPVHLTGLGKLLESVLPDSLCYMPKRKDSYTGTGLRERGYLKAAPPDWEEFMWRDAPFGFHVRRNREKRFRDEGAEKQMLMRTVEEFAPGLVAETKQAGAPLAT